MTRLASITVEQLKELLNLGASYAEKGELAQYIPTLASVSRHRLAVAIQTVTGESLAVGDTLWNFPLMSVVKPFLLLYLLSQLGSKSVFKLVGVKPSEDGFNSLGQLKADEGKPRNPMINSGAIALASLLPGADPKAKCLNLCDWLNHYGSCHFFLDQSMLDSVSEAPNLRNIAIADTLYDAGYINEPQVALATYNHICCLSGRITDLAALGMLLETSHSAISQEHRRLVKGVIMTCGLYQASPRWAIQLGLPTKSGVSGAVLSIVPRQGAISVFSPPLDPEGNSLVGLFLLEKLSHLLDLSIFG